MTRRLATVFGGSGFLGRHVVRRLAQEGYRVRVAVRDPVGAEFLKPMGQVEQVVPIGCDVHNDVLVEAAMRDSELVVNLVGVLYESGRNSFQAIHVEAARRIATIAKRLGVPQLIHVSALGADKNSESAYARSKAEGEEAVRAAFPEAVIFRPSVVFGPEDQFFNKFASLSTLSPALPVITRNSLVPKFQNGRLVCPCGNSPRFQPVYVADVAEAILAARAPQFAGKTFELGGPRVYSMREVMQLVLKVTCRKRFLAPLPVGLANFVATFLQLLPKPLLTKDQVKLMGKDNVLTGAQPGLEAFDIKPTAAEAILPAYMWRFQCAEDRAKA